jgi:hypothetical protein
MASKIVVLPAPVGPVIANKPDSRNGDSSKRISCVPFREFKFRKRILTIFMGVLGKLAYKGKQEREKF